MSRQFSRVNPDSSASAGVDLWFPLSAESADLETLKKSGHGHPTSRTPRIELGIAEWGNELSIT